MPQLIYGNEETQLVWADSGGDYALTFKGLATGTGRQGATHDFGTAARAVWCVWRLMVHFDTGTTPVVDEMVEAWAKTSDGTNWDNDDGEGDIALSNTDKLKNCNFLRALRVDEAAVDVPMSTGGIVLLPATEFAPIVFNATADTLDDDTSPTNSRFILTPFAWEIQD